MLKPENVILNWSYIWDTLEIDWKEVSMTFNGNKILVMIKFRDKFRIRCMMKREPLLFHNMLKQGLTWLILSFNTQETIRQYRYFSRMDFNFKAHCDFDFHYFHCAIPEETVDMEMSIQTVDGIHTYWRDQTTQMNAYCSRGRQAKSFSSIQNKITDYEEEKWKSCENKYSNLFTSVRESKSGQKRSRKYKKLDMGHSVPSTVASACPTTTITISTATLSASAPTGPPELTPSGRLSTSNTLSTPKPQMHRLPHKTWAICCPTPAQISPSVHYV